MSVFVKLKTELFQYYCECGNNFKSSVYPVGMFGYGEFLLRSLRSDIFSYLYAIDDITYSEVSRLAKSDSRLVSFNESKKSEIFQEIVGLAYDFEDKDGQFKIGLLPLCPVCGTRNIKKYNSMESPEFKVIEVPTVTSEKWQKLSNGKKSKLVYNAITNCLNN